MKHFLRALRLALNYRFTVLMCFFSAVMVGILWGANIGTIYPFVEVAFKGQTLQNWIDQEIAGSEKVISELEQEIADCRRKLDEGMGDARALRSQLDQAEHRLESEREHLVRSQFVKPYIYEYLPNDPFKTIVVLSMVLLTGTLIKCIFVGCNNYMVHKLSNLVTFDLRKLLFRKTLRMDMASFDTDGSGELMSRFTYDMESVFNGTKVVFGKAVREPLKMLACLIGAALVCWQLLLISLILAPVAAVFMGKLGRMLKRANRRAMEEMTGIYSLLDEIFQGIKVVKAFTTERHERIRFHRSSRKYYDKSMKIGWFDALTRPLSEVMGVSTILVALLAGAYLVLEGETHLFGIRMCDRPLSLSALLLFYGMLSGVSDPARKMSEVFGRVQRAAAACDRIYARIDREPTICDPPSPKPLPRHHRDIVFRNVTFGYQDDHPVIENIDLRVKFGETIAIVGPNGCGKSTLMSLIPRFYDPQKGSVEIDGVDIRETRLRQLRKQIGLVTQETLLFDDTVFNNIRYGCPHATEEQVLAAAKKAHADRFIRERLSNGYDTVLGPGGGQLSGGQRQRIALARAILRDPPILLLDEATSQVDLESEQLIHQVLEQFIKNRTTFIITHRMSTLVLADRVVVMNQGRIIDVGRHEELLGRCQLYTRLYDIQFRQSA